MAARPVVPSFRSLVEETDDLIKLQRQKGAEYKFREGPGRPYLALDGDVAPPPDSAHGATAAGSPAKAKMEGTASAAPLSLDAYDPKEMAEREQRALVELVSKMRAEASTLYAEVGALTRRYDSQKATLEQLAYEDDVDGERSIGVKKMRELKARTYFLQLSVSDAEHYSRVLTGMTKRLTDEKLSALATMKAFEDALRVQRSELELSQEVQRSVVKSRGEEVAELSRMSVDVKKQLALLDKKLEARRNEVKTRQDKAKWRVMKMQEEMSLKAQAEGDLTEEEERQMIEKAKNLSAEAAQLRAEKLKAQNEADSVQEEYVKVRNAAGVAAPAEASDAMSSPRTASADGEEADELSTFVPPDTAPVIKRFNLLEDEMRNIEEQLSDYSTRLNVLSQQRVLLRGLAEPRAKDEADETDRDVECLPELRERITNARRALEGASREVEEASSLRMKIEQSVAVLADRLASLAPPYMGASTRGASPASVEADAMAMAALEDVASRYPTSWSRGVHARTVSAVRVILSIIRVMDPVAAAAGLARAQAMLVTLAGGDGEAAAEEQAAAIAPRTSRADAGSGSSALAPSEAPTEEEEPSAGELEDNRRLDATIESLIVKNEWSIRVRPGSSGPSRSTKAISGRALAEAVQAFEKTWKDASTGAVTSAPVALHATADYRVAAADKTADQFSLEASRQRRRNSRIELENVFTAAAVTAVTMDDVEPGATGKRSKVDSKPKTKDITRFLATAASMAGDEVDDGAMTGAVLNRREAEDVLTRDRVKRNVAVATAAQAQAGAPPVGKAAGKR